MAGSQKSMTENSIKSNQISNIKLSVEVKSPDQLQTLLPLQPSWRLPPKKWQLRHRDHGHWPLQIGGSNQMLKILQYCVDSSTDLCRTDFSPKIVRLMYVRLMGGLSN